MLGAPENSFLVQFREKIDYYEFETVRQIQKQIKTDGTLANPL